MPSPLTIAQLCGLAPDSWVNDGFIATVRTIEIKNKKAGGNFWKCALADPTGATTVNCSLFVAPRFKQGDVIEVTGKGIKYKDGQYGKEVSVSDKASINVLGASVHHAEQAERLADSRPAINGQDHPVNGQTVGMAMKEAVGLLTHKLTHDEAVARIITPVFWQSVHEVSSDIIRVSRLLEAGKLAKPVRERQPGYVRPPEPSAAASGRADPLASRAKPAPGPEGSAFPTGGANEDVPF